MSWPNTRLADHCEVITKGTTPTTLGHEFTDSGVPFLRVQNVEGGSLTLDRDTLFISESTHRVLERSQIHPGDVLVTIAGTIGRAGVVPNGAPALNCNQAVAIVRSKNDFHRPFLRHWLESSGAQAQMRGATVTGTISNLSLTQLGNLKVPLPPLSEQRRIAEILDKADALRAKRHAALAQLDTLTQSIFLDMFGEPATNPKGWPRLPIGEVSGGADNWNPSSSPDAEFVYIDIAAIDQARKRITGARRMMGRDAPSRARQRIRTGDLLVSTVRPNLNAVATVPAHLDGATASTGFCVLRPQEGRINSDYLFSLVRGAAFVGAMMRQATGASYPAVTDPIVRAWVLPCPPLVLQNEYAHRVRTITRVQTCGDASLEEMEGLFVSLQHRAFRGEL